MTYYYTIFIRDDEDDDWKKDRLFNEHIEEDGELPTSLGELMKRISQFDGETYLKDDHEYKPVKIEKLDE